MTALPGLCLFLSASVYCLLSNRLKRRPLRYALRAATALLFLPLLYWNIGAVAAYFFAPPPEDHKYLLKALQATARATDKIICADGNSAVFLARYAPTLQSAAEIVELGSFPDSILDTVGQSRVWLVYRSPKASSLDAAIQKRGLSHLDLSVRGKNTGLVLVWPKGVTRETVLSDAMAIHSQVLAFAGPNRGNVLLALGENAKRSQDKTAEETAGIFARAINPLRRLSLINPTDASAHLALATAYENVANYSAAARAYSRALLLSSTPGAAFRIGENLVLCLNDGRVNQPGIPSPRGIVQRLALRRLDTIDLLSNGSFERCDGTGRPLGWAMATPEALATIPSNVSPADGAQFAVLRSTPSYWAFLGYTLPACPALFAGNGLSVTVYAQAPATDLMFLSVDMKSNGKDVSLARKAWPQSDGKWIPLTLEVDAIPTLEQATLRVRVTVRNVPDRTCLIDNASAYLKRAK
jgi:tetratricopeptide (TPR) repeat protein